MKTTEQEYIDSYNRLPFLLWIIIALGGFTLAWLIVTGLWFLGKLIFKI